MPLVLDGLTKQMRLRVESLKQLAQAEAPGWRSCCGRLSRVRIDFIQQHRLQFGRWDVVLDQLQGRSPSQASQNWTADLTSLATRQLLDRGHLLAQGGLESHGLE